ncbi:MAG: Putative dioxygenase [uncultured Paraburkholderia sp.]|nr:MAG: Putative dioxygenase [uncultured Paraburkholderia sp.]CAH2792293.1 MAG: Putative dioxygenase [uncultured Paraburkholderia sp.]CAH2928747.1 MAG: Putative dioxygenase [uncultured Paraburkholderia sp.]
MSATTTVLPPFHLAFPVHSLAAAREFYGELLGCPEGRSSEHWVDFNFYGHQIVAHLAPDEIGHRQTSKVDGDAVPVRHFGAVLSMEQWQAAADKLQKAGIDFIIEPHVRFKGEVGEQGPCSSSTRRATRSNSRRLPTCRRCSQSKTHRKGVGQLK